MSYYEKQRIEIAKRNEINKAYRKRMMIYYIGLFAPWVVAIILLLVLGSFRNVLPIGEQEMKTILFLIMPTLTIIWILWVIIGIFLTRCPHCGGFLFYVRGKIRCCPHCATIMEITPDFDENELK